MTISLKSIVNVQLLWIQPKKCWQQWKSSSQTNQRWFLKQTQKLQIVVAQEESGGTSGPPPADSDNTTDTEPFDAGTEEAIQT